MFSKELVCEKLKEIREKSPLVHNITNYVVMNLTANALLSLGASPVMAHSLNEVEEMVSIASSVVLNIGTLSPEYVDAMEIAVKSANRKNIPVVLDPVGAGATVYRTSSVKRLLNAGRIDVIRGNASEIRALLESEGKTKGVDSVDTTDSAVDSGLRLSKKYNCTVSISGKVDVVLKKEKIIRIDNGSPLMSKVTGLGCVATSITGAFLAVCEDSFEAAASAMAIMGICGEVAFEKAKTPGSFQVAFLDELYLVDEDVVRNRLRII